MKSKITVMQNFTVNLNKMGDSKMSKWTDGPWWVGETDHNEQRQIVTSNGRLIAVATHECVKSHLPEMETNAHLIAAAPELYEALETMQSDGHWEADCWIVSEEAERKADKALAKAQGEQK